MTIHQQSAYIISHPAIQFAISEFNRGNEKELLILLTDIQYHCIDTQVKNSAREYGACKRMLGSDIKKKLLNISPPENLNVQLHIPIGVKVKYCKVVSIKEGIDQIKKRVVKVFNPHQLAFPFPEALFQA